MQDNWSSAVGLTVIEIAYQPVILLQHCAVICHSSTKLTSVCCIILLLKLTGLNCRRRILVVARVIGRFETRRIISDKPFITAMVRDIVDEPPQTFQQAADISAAAMRLWQCMQQVKELAGKLYSHVGPIGESSSD